MTLETNSRTATPKRDAGRIATASQTWDVPLPREVFSQKTLIRPRKIRAGVLPAVRLNDGRGALFASAQSLGRMSYCVSPKPREECG